MFKTWVTEIKDKVGKSVELYGWVHARRDHGKIIFIDLRDRSGITQLVFIPAHKEVYAQANSLRPEWVIRVRGTVSERPEKMVNPDIETGNVEIPVDELEILNKSDTPPIALDTDGTEIGEEHRLRYRYLDIRRERVRNNLILRHKVLKHIRDYLTERDFIEVETPILSKSTPEGARDYIVPSRLHHGLFYALPQSPQQYKQLLMVSGIERYFQIARCFRDEDTRGDRQPEFTQLDLEMSFTSKEDILKLIENLYIDIVEAVTPEKTITETPFPRMTYEEVMEKYGTDKPDLRKNKKDPNELAFLFVVDFPMFEWRESEKRWDTAHHPFTQPDVKDADDLRSKFNDDPKQILAYQYDFVCNGYELAGGSIRIHDPELLSAVFELLGHKKEEIDEKFGHILEAFKYGVPPHGGIAPGLDRFIMILANEPNIREVITFPKTGDGRDLMMDAPSKVDKKQLDELGIEIKKQ